LRAFSSEEVPAEAAGNGGAASVELEAGCGFALVSGGFTGGFTCSEEGRGVGACIVVIVGYKLKMSNKLFWRLKDSQLQRPSINPTRSQ
jgi:hypothetical protein